MWTLLLVLGCVPSRIHFPEPALSLQATNTVVRLDYPVDVRLRSEGGYFDGSIPVSTAAYGDLNLRPHPVDALNLHTQAALTHRGIGVAEDGALSVAVYLVDFKGTRETSDAMWVSTATGGAAGFVGAFVYPHFMTVSALARIEVRDADGTLLATRDVDTLQLKQMPARMTTSYMWLWTRNPPKEHFTTMFGDAVEELSADIADVVASVAKGEVPTAGRPPRLPLQHTLHPHRTDDTFAALTDVNDVDASIRKYGDSRMSVLTGHDLGKGDVVGRISLPFDTFGYEAGITDRVHGQIDLTVLGFYNRLSLGSRFVFFDGGAMRLAVYGWGGAQFVLFEADFSQVATGGPNDLTFRFDPGFAGWATGGGAQWSHRYGDVTLFARSGLFSAQVQRAYPELFPDLEEGTVTGFHVSPGLEVQLSPTLTSAISVRAARTLTAGADVEGLVFAPYSIVPQLAIGLR
jgi:hypothetical protein